MAAEVKPKMQSQIPVMAPRPSQSSLPTSLSSPHLGLVPPTRHLAVSASPTHSPTTSGSNPSSSPGSTPFRSFRNFLSFGPGKSQASNASSSGATSAGPSRPSLGALRRSTTAERSVSAPQHLASKAPDAIPVLSIQFSHKVDEPLIDNEELQSRLCIQPRTPESSSPLSTVSTLSSRVALVTPENPGTS